MADKIWNKLFEALLTALIPVIMKAFQEWLEEMSADQVAAILTDKPVA